MEADMSVYSLITRASVLVQIVMLTLVSASVLSWVIIVVKHRILKFAKEEAERFEDQFWSGINLSELYQRIRKKSDERRGMAKIFQAGFAVKVHIWLKLLADKFSAACACSYEYRFFHKNFLQI